MNINLTPFCSTDRNFFSFFLFFGLIREKFLWLDIVEERYKHFGLMIFIPRMHEIRRFKFLTLEKVKSTFVIVSETKRLGLKIEIVGPRNRQTVTWKIIVYNKISNVLLSCKIMILACWKVACFIHEVSFHDN